MFYELKKGNTREKKNSVWTYKASKGNNMIFNIEVTAD